MTIQQIYNYYYKHLDKEIFNAAVAADPTSYNHGQVVKVGNFVKWILKLYRNNFWKPGDSYETKDLLSKFIKYKSKLPIDKRDINRYYNISELYSLMQTLESEGVKSQKEVKREGVEVVYEDSEWKIVIPHTEEASCIYGAHTKWCTAGRNCNMFNYYNEKGPLYININKQTGDKYQFHFESGSFMDAEDKRISLKNIGLSDGVLEYYKSIGKEPYFIYDNVSELIDGFAKVELEGKYNFIDTNGKLVWDKDEWFDDAWEYYKGFARVYKKGRGCNFIDTNSELLWKDYKNFDYVGILSDGYAVVKLDGKSNFIRTNGELLWDKDEWFDNIENFSEGFAWIYKKGRGWNLININGELVWKEYKCFDRVWDFKNGFAIVYKEGLGWNLINEQGELLWKEDIWFDYVGGFDNGFSRFYIEGRGWNFINTNGELLWKEDIWFDGISYFSEGFASVYKQGKGYNFINEQGELLWKGDKWFDDAFGFSYGFAGVKLESKWKSLNSKGELVN